jgi:ribosomal protein S7
MILFKKNLHSLIPQVSTKVSFISSKDKLDHIKNILRLKYYFKVLNFKKKNIIYKNIGHNKFFSLRVKREFVIRQYSKQKFNTKFKLVLKKNVSSLNLYNNFVSFIFRSGKKHIWQKIFSDIFLLIKNSLKFSQNIILLKIFLRLYTKIEVKKVKSRRKTVLVPVFISVRRRFFLALKWLLLAVNKNKLQISLKEKLFLEIFKLVKNKSCESIKYLELNNQNVYLNRANFHYRW